MDAMMAVQDFANKPAPAVSSPQEFAAVGFGLYGYSHAKRMLVDWGHDKADVEKMPVGQVLSLYSARVYQTVSDDMERTYYVPFSQAQRLDDEANRKLREAGVLTSNPVRELVPIAQLLLPAVNAARSAEVRLERDLAALRVIEALRMHAARNDGQLPKTLEQVTCVPVPLNPATDKPFIYHLKNETAVLELPDWEGFHGYTRRYEITIAKPNQK
jgi:hypothetical protein